MGIMIDTFEIRFSIALAKFLKFFNLLEKSLGLSISHLENPSNPKKSYPKLVASTAEQKIETWLSLLVESRKIVKKSHQNELEHWKKAVHELRFFRNLYVHGNWEYLPLRRDAPVGVRFPIWWHEKLGEDAFETMTLGEFESSANEMKMVFNQFMDIRKKHAL